MSTEVIEPTAGDLLRHAAVILDEWGLAKKVFVCDKGAMCEEGALRAAAGRDIHIWNEVEMRWERRIETIDYWSAFHLAISALYGSGGGPDHNDKSVTTKQSAIAKLLEAAELADKRAQS